jgi:prepilin-type N-terminal cleavage/methylation domain-containing protein
MSETSLSVPKSNRGFSLVELLLVLMMTSVITAIAIPTVITQRRLFRSTSLMREVATQLRYARQLSMSRRQAITFQYNDTTKQIRIINQYNNRNPNTVCNVDRTAIFGQGGFPDTACSALVATVPLANGVAASEIGYGIPSGTSLLPAGAPVIPITKLDDNILLTPLTPTAGGTVSVTFQPDGSVIDATGIPVDRALFFYNSTAAQDTASAISVVGASGRVKVWRYTVNGNKYVE